MKSYFKCSNCFLSIAVLNMHSAVCLHLHCMHSLLTSASYKSAMTSAAENVLCVKTIMAAPISNQFRVGSVQVLVSESQQLHALPAAF